MRSLRDVLSAQTGRPTRRSTRRYRAGSVFVHDLRAISRPLDRNQRARLLMFAEALERRTKAKGRRNGAVGYIGLAILRALLLRFLGLSGACFPSYEALQRHTGLARASIAEGLRRLEAAGIITIVRRIVRKRIVRDGQEVVSTVQGSNVYSFCKPSSRGEEQSRPKTKKKGLGDAERAESPRPELDRGSLGELAGIMLKRLAGTEPDWRSAARAMARRRA